MGATMTAMFSRVHRVFDSPADIIYIGLLLLGATIIVGIQSKRAVRWSPCAIGALVGVALSPKMVPWLTVFLGQSEDVLTVLCLFLGGILGQYVFSAIISALVLRVVKNLPFSGMVRTILAACTGLIS